MKNNKTILTIILVVLAVSCMMFACGEQNDRAGIKVVYELEGGVYKNSVKSVEVRYEFGSASKKRIKSLDEFETGSSVIKQGYRIEGWYKTKTGEGDDVVYSDKWDFETDEVSESGVTLYARWIVNAVYKYSIGYYNGDEFVEVGSYETAAGVPFKENFVKKAVLAAADKYEGHTATGEFFADKDMTEKFDEEFMFEESMQSLTKRIVAKYIEGQYVIINTASDLENAVYNDDSAYKGKSLYIMNDIDLGGGTLNLSALFETKEGYADAADGIYDDKLIRFTGIEGANGVKKIVNFVTATDGRYTETDYDGNEVGTVRASLIGDVEGVSIKNVSFEKVEFQVAADNSDTMKKVVTAPLCGSAKNCSFENVKIEISAYKVRLFVNDPEFIESKQGGAWKLLYKDDGGNKIENCSATVAAREEGVF